MCRLRLGDAQENAASPCSTFSACGEGVLPVDFAAREELRTEISAKFTAERLEADLRAAGLELSGWFSDPADLFAVF